MEQNNDTGSVPFKIRGNWVFQSRQLKQQYAELTDADLQFETGKENDLLARLEAKLNKKREEVIDIIMKGQPTRLPF